MYIWKSKSQQIYRYDGTTIVPSLLLWTLVADTPVKELYVKKKALNLNQVVRVLFQRAGGNPAKNVSHSLHQLCLEVKVVGEEIEVERDDGGEYKDNQEGWG